MALLYSTYILNSSLSTSILVARIRALVKQGWGFTALKQHTAEQADIE